MRILIADDSATTRYHVRSHLEGLGLEVLEAKDGEQAWELLNTEPFPQLAVLDWMMPGMDGVEICALLRQRAEPFVYTILLTSKTDTEDMVFALEQGAHNFQSKPISREKLRAHVAVGRRLVEAEVSLQKSHQAVLTVLNSVQESIMLTDLAGVLKEYNQAASDLFGLAEAPPDSVEVLRLFNEQQECMNFLDLWDQVAMGGQVEGEWAGRSLDGDTFPVQIFMRHLTMGEAEYVMVVVSDLTERQQIERERLVQERLQAAMQTAGAACHQLNQPLQAALSRTEIALMRAQLDPDMEKAMRLVLEQLNRMGEITRKLNSLTRYRTTNYLSTSKILDLEGSSKA